MPLSVYYTSNVCIMGPLFWSGHQPSFFQNDGLCQGHTRKKKKKQEVQNKDPLLI